MANKIHSTKIPWETPFAWPPSCYRWVFTNFPIFSDSKDFLLNLGGWTKTLLEKLWVKIRSLPQVVRVKRKDRSNKHPANPLQNLWYPRCWNETLESRNTPWLQWLELPWFSSQIFMTFWGSSHLLPSLKLTFSPLKMDAWNTTFLLGPGLFSGAKNVSFRECTLSHYTPPLEHVVVTELLQEMGCCEAATQPSNKKSPGNHSSQYDQHVEDPITKKKHCTKYHLNGDSTKNTSTSFLNPKTWTHRFDPPGHLVFPQPDTASREAKKHNCTAGSPETQPPRLEFKEKHQLESTHLLLSFYVLNLHGGKFLYQITSIAAFKNPGGLHQGGFSTKNLRQRLWLGFTSLIIFFER